MYKKSTNKNQSFLNLLPSPLEITLLHTNEIPLSVLKTKYYNKNEKTDVKQIEVIYKLIKIFL